MIDDSLLEYANERLLLYGVPYSGITTTNDNVFHYQHGQLHREDGPAVEWANGSTWWYIHGNPHREDGPAIDGADGSKWWYIHGELHREDGPAIERADGSKEWWIHGNRIYTWKEYHMLSTLSPQEQMIVKLKDGEQLQI